MKLHPDVTSKIVKETFTDLEERFNEVHGDTYDYTKSVFTTKATRLTITCDIHGDFLKSPKAHIEGSGCNPCRISKRATEKIARFREVFIDRANIVHNFKYTYIGEYNGADKHLLMSCPIEGHGEFPQRPNAHLKGQGCPICGDIQKGITQSNYSRDKLVSAVQNIHGDKYTINKEDYHRDGIPMKVYCNFHNNDFLITPTVLLQGGGCQYCGEISKQLARTNNPTCLYYVKIENKYTETVYKIGVTSKPLNERFKGEQFAKDFTVLLQSSYMDRRTVLEFEQEILIKYKSSLLGSNTILAHGTNEIFNKDIVSEIKHYFKRSINE